MFDPRRDTIRTSLSPATHGHNFATVSLGNGSLHGYESNNFVGCSVNLDRFTRTSLFPRIEISLEGNPSIPPFLVNMERNESKWLSRNINNNWLLMIDKEEFKDGSFSVICKNVISLKITIIVNQSI